MKYNLNINQHNIKPHLDIERDIQNKKNGLFTFDLRINQGNIEHYATRRIITSAEYTSVTIATFEESVTTHHLGEGSQGSAIRPDKR